MRTSALPLLLALILLVPHNAFTAPPGPDKPPPADALLAEADAIATKLASFRGLAPTAPIKKGVYNREQLRAALLLKIGQEMSDLDIEREGMLYKALGMLPQDTNYKQLLLDLLTEQIAGFYDPDAQELYIMEGMPRDLQRATISHEIFHAIQDQHFDLKSLQGPFPATQMADFHVARSALIEGDATVAMIDFSMVESGELPRDGATSFIDLPLMAPMIAQLSFHSLSAVDSLATPSSKQPSQMDRAPLFLRESLTFPYVAGLRFIIAARQRRTWVEVDSIYKDAPVSTEQILHPERYFQRDMPTIIAMDPDPALSGYTRVQDNALGELHLYLFLKEHLRKPHPQSKGKLINASRAAEGWDGDRIMLYTAPDKAPLLIHMSVWDSEAEASAYLEALDEVAARRWPDAVVERNAGKHGESIALNSPAEQVYLERWGDLILHIEGLPAGQPDALVALRAQLWKSFKRIPFEQELARVKAAAKPAKPAPLLR
jgi:hypothetical protein